MNIHLQLRLHLRPHPPSDDSQAPRKLCCFAIIAYLLRPLAVTIVVHMGARKKKFFLFDMGHRSATVVLSEAISRRVTKQNKITWNTKLE